MERNPYAGNIEPSAEQLKITRKIPLSHFGTALDAEDPVELMLGQITKQHLAKLNAHWYETVFISLTVDPKKQIVKINIRAPQVKQLLNPHSSLKGGKSPHAGAGFVTPDGFPVYYPRDLINAEGD